MITFIEHDEPGYPGRTIKNCMTANLTIAFATDFHTAGEILTRKASYDKYFPVKITDDLSIESWVYDQLTQYILHRKVKEINIAGNGIYPLKHTQEALNVYMERFIAEINTRFPAGFKWRSGGQTGIDEAALVAADRLKLDATCLAPKGWMFRDKFGVDIQDEQKFVERFYNDLF